VAAVREWNAKLGPDATYLICSHGDVIKAIVADSLGLHLDQCQRIQADPCSLTVIRYTPLRPFLVRMNDRGGGVDDLMPHVRGHRSGAASDAAVGGGSGGADHTNADHMGADHMGADHMGADHMGADHMGADPMGADHMGADHMNADHMNGQANATPSTTAAFSIPDSRQPSADTRG
jgi:pentapeptide MXKDX repeat protein